MPDHEVSEVLQKGTRSDGVHETENYNIDVIVT